jgi:hypothetical protein
MFYSWEISMPWNTPMLDEQRPVYLSSGRFVFSDVLVGACCLFGVALFLASILAWLTAIEFFAVGLIWIFPAMIVYWLVRRTVGSTKTRNRLVGFVLGLFAGTVLVLGLYHIDQCSRWGVGWHSLDRLPGYVTFRMETDLWVHEGRAICVHPVPSQAGIVPWVQPRVTFSRQWAAFFGEVVVIMFISGFVGLQRARRPFSEQLNEWFNRESLVLTQRSASDLLSAMQTGTLEDWMAIGIEKTGYQEKHAVVTFWYCLHSGRPDAIETSVYVSFGEGSCLLLHPEEAAVLSQIVPGLIEFAIPTEGIYEDDTNPLSDPTVAQLIKIPGPYVGQAKKPSVILMGGIKLIVMAFLLPFGSLALLALFACFSDRLGLPVWAVVALIVATGLVLLASMGSLIGEKDLAVRMIRRHYRNAVAAETALRSDALFSPDDPRLIYVDLTPRRNWSELFEKRNGNDTGFLLIDTDRQQVLYEGDTFRFIIPATSILRCEVEEINRNAATTGLFYVTVIIARTKTGTHAFPFAALEGIAGANRFEKVVALRNRILSELETATR